MKISVVSHYDSWDRVCRVDLSLISHLPNTNSDQEYHDACQYHGGPGHLGKDTWIVTNLLSRARQGNWDAHW